MSDNRYGAFVMSPAGPFEAGSYTTITFTYTVGEAGLKRGGRLRIATPNQGWEEPLVLCPTSIEEIVEGPQRAHNPWKPINTSFELDTRTDAWVKMWAEERWVAANLVPDREGWEWASRATVWRWWIVADVERADFEPGDRIVVTYGDTEDQPFGIRVQPFPNDKERPFLCVVDVEGNGDLREADGSPVYPLVVSGPPERIVAAAPSIAAPGETFTVRASALDRNLTRLLLKPFGRSAPRILMGLMIVTAALSMFMSNTATTATMMAVVLPVLARLPADSRLRGGLALSIPVAANIGGMGTPVGTPPNAIALGTLAESGYTITFVDWMVMTVPFMLLILLAAWALIVRAFARGAPPLEIDIDARFDRSRPALILYAVFAATLLLWLTEPLHGIKSYVVGFLPVVVLLCTGVFTTRDMQSLQWHVLWLVAGGIALGAGVTLSGFDHWLIGLVDWSRMSTGVVAAGLCVLALAMGTVISHSATANLLIPIGISLAAGELAAVSPVRAGVFIAIGASLAMALPISTPPNAIAYSTGAIRTSHMAFVGAVIGVLGTLLFVFVAPPFWKLLGLLPV